MALFAVFEAVINRSLFISGIGVQNTLGGIDKVIGCYRRAVVPLCIAQVEGINHTILADVPSLGDTGIDLTAVPHHKTFIDVAENAIGTVVITILGIQGGRIIALSEADHVVPVFSTVFAAVRAAGGKGHQHQCSQQ